MRRRNMRRRNINIIFNMLFKEKETKKGYNYTVEDVFGIIELNSSAQLNSKTLDNIVFKLLQIKSNSKILAGSVKDPKKDLEIEYRFERVNTWEKIDKDEVCKNTSTFTKKLAREFIHPYPLRIIERILNWFKRFVVAFREAWKKTK